MKVVVTGADGFVGRELTGVLRQQGHEVVAVARQAKPGYVAVGDISGTTDWSAVLSGADVVVHLAARVHQMGDRLAPPWAEYRRVNVDATLNLASQADRAGVGRFIFMSSVKVLGEENDRPYVESDTPAPSDAYGVTKWEAEQGLTKLAKNNGMDVVVVRPPLVYGPGVKGNFASLVRLVRRGLPLPLGAVWNRRSLIGVDNLVNFVALCADQKKTPQAANEVFLVSDGVDVSTTELLRQVAGACGKRVWLLPVPARWLRWIASLLGRSAVADRLCGSLAVDISKARTLLGWHPATTMDQQLRKMSEYDARL